LSPLFGDVDVLVTGVQMRGDIEFVERAVEIFASDRGQAITVMRFRLFHVFWWRRTTGLSRRRGGGGGGGRVHGAGGFRRRFGLGSCFGFMRFMDAVFGIFDPFLGALDFIVILDRVLPMLNRFGIVAVGLSILRLFVSGLTQLNFYFSDHAAGL